MEQLALTLRPTALEGFVGQPHLVGQNGAISALLEKKSIPHSFFWGPPGTGKTTLAKIIATMLQKPFYALNATDLKVEDLRKILKPYQHALEKPLLFIDEVHRMSKTQQEVLLPVMEHGEALIIGCSTENPFFSLTSAIRSRSMQFVFVPLGDAELHALLELATQRHDIALESKAKDYLVSSSGGDARAMLNLLEYAAKIAHPITLECLKSLRPTALHDGSSSDETHYNLASAMIKSIRGSDENAAIYYLARLIEGGEPPEFIARRLVILAAEDIGNANPDALILANATLQSVARIGYPESRILLSQCLLYLCASPKSNTAYTAINAAQQAVREGALLEIPKSSRQNHQGYLYPHDYGGWVEQTYLEKPLDLVEWKPIGFEKRLMEWLQKIRGRGL